MSFISHHCVFSAAATKSKENSFVLKIIDIIMKVQFVNGEHSTGLLANEYRLPGKTTNRQPKKTYSHLGGGAFCGELSNFGHAQ